MRSSVVLSFIVTSAALSLVACSGDSASEQETQSTDTAVSAITFAQSLAGTYSHVELPGTYQELTTLVLNKDGSYAADKPGHKHENGTFAATRSPMTLTLKPTRATSRKYTLEIEGDHSSMQLTRAGRTEVFSSDVTTPPGCQSDADCAQGETCKFAETGSTCVPSTTHPPVDAGNCPPPGACANRHGGALITFNIAGQSLTVWSTNAAFIAESKTLLASGDHRTPTFETVIDGADCDSQYSWHVDPATMSYSDFTTEVCDGTPSYLEANKATWIRTVGRYCPWGPTVTYVIEQ